MDVPTTPSSPFSAEAFATKVWYRHPLVILLTLVFLLPVGLLLLWRSSGWSRRWKVSLSLLSIAWAFSYLLVPDLSSLSRLEEPPLMATARITAPGQEVIIGSMGFRLRRAFTAERVPKASVIIFNGDTTEGSFERADEGKKFLMVEVDCRNTISSLNHSELNIPEEAVYLQQGTQWYRIGKWGWNTGAIRRGSTQSLTFRYQIPKDLQGHGYLRPDYWYDQQVLDLGQLR